MFFLLHCSFPPSSALTTQRLPLHYTRTNNHSHFFLSKRKRLEIPFFFFFFFSRIPNSATRYIVLNRWENTERICKWAGRRCIRWRPLRRWQRPRLQGLEWKTFREWPEPPARSSSASASSPSPPFLYASWPQPPTSHRSPPSGQHLYAFISELFLYLLFGIRV